MKITWSVNKDTPLHESGQDFPVRFAYLYKDPEKEGHYISQTPLMKCRDYFNEIWLKEKFPEKVVPVTYKLDINLLQHNLKDTEWFYILLDFNLIKPSLNKFIEWLPKFNEFELTKEIKPTEIVGKQLQWNRFVIRCDRKYFSNTVTLSMFTCILRMMCNHLGDVEELPWHQNLFSTNMYKFARFPNYFKNIDKFFDIDYLEVLKSLGKTSVDNCESYLWHNSTGFYTMSNSGYDNQFKQTFSFLRNEIII